MKILDHNSMNKIRIYKFTRIQINECIKEQMEEKEYFFLTVEFQLLNVEVWWTVYWYNIGIFPHKL